MAPETDPRPDAPPDSGAGSAPPLRPQVPARARVKRDDLAGGVAIFPLANAALLPLAAPFALIADLARAQRVSKEQETLWVLGVRLRAAF